MNPADHFNDDFLIRILRDPAELQQSGRAEHLAACAVCQNCVDVYRRVQALMRGESAFEVPDTWVERMVDLFHAETVPTTLAPAETFAWLAFDSLCISAAGVRSITTPRNLTWESQDFHIDLMVASSGQNRTELVGQLMERKAEKKVQFAGTIVELRTGADIFTSEVNDTGEFIAQIGRVTPGDAIEIRFRLSGRPALTLLIPC